MSTIEMNDNGGFKMKFSSCELFSKLDTFRQKKQFCDIKLSVEGNEFFAHKAVLSAVSLYFETMFSCQLAEAQQSTVTLPNVDAEVMKIILDFAYSKSIEVRDSNVQAIMLAANYFQVESLFSACCGYLEKNVNAENCFSILELASLYLGCYQKLAEAAKQYIISNFEDVCLREQFLELESDTLIDIIQDDLLHVVNEDTVFRAVVRWLRSERERIFEFDRVLSHVRLAFVDPIVLNDVVDRLELYNWPACMKLIEEVENYHLFPSRRADILCSIRTRRVTAPECEGLVIHCRSHGESVMKCFNIKADVVKIFTYPPGDCRRIVVSDYTQTMVACCWDKLYLYNIGRSKGRWRALKANLKPRYFYGLCELDGMWYSIGGKIVGGRTCDAFEKYNPVSKTWKALPFLPIAVSSPAVVCHRGRIFVIGGFFPDGSACSVIQQYDPISMAWIMLTNMPVTLQFPAACVLDGMIYIFCFSRESDSDGQRVYVYDPLTNQFDVRCEMPSKFLGGPVCMYGKIFVLTRKSESQSVVMCYVPSVDCWEQFGAVLEFKTNLMSGPFIVKKT